MSTFAKTLGRIALLMVCLSWLAVMSTADAQEGNAPNESSVLAPPAAPVLEVPQLAPPANSPPRPFLRPADDESRERVQAAPSRSQNKVLPAQELPRAPVQYPFLRSAGPNVGEVDDRYRSDEGVRSYALPSEKPMPPPYGDLGVEVRPTPPIKYDTDRGARRMYRESGTAEIIMLVQNPADGCYYEIPLCIPACCAGEEPSMKCDTGIFGRGEVEYCWPCGFEAEVKFRHILGDVKVEYDA